MSIRLRLSLLFSVILALTLGITSTAVYISQSRYTLSIIEMDFERFSGGMVASWQRVLEWVDTPPPDVDEFSRNDFIRAFDNQDKAPKWSDGRSPYHDNLGVLNAEGGLLDLQVNEDTTVIQPSEEMLALLATGEVQTEIVTVDGDRYFVYNAPAIEANTGEFKGIVQMSRSLADRDRSMSSLGVTLGGGTLLITLIAFGIGWLFAGYTLRPIDRITRSAQQIGETQDFSSRVEYEGPNDELGHLAHTFNDMLENLEQSYAQLTHALQVQQDFVADVSHELRTPLTTIRGNLALLKRNNIPRGERVEILDDVIEESERLSRLTTDLLMLARADAGHQLPVAPVDVADIIMDVRRQSHLLAPDRNIATNDESVSAIANHDALKQVLIILVDNALKHGQGTISVQTSNDSEDVFILVGDEGPGMETELVARIFDRFYRGDASRSTPGFGLGLSIAKALVEAQQGSISVASVPDIGTSFLITLPVA